MNKLKLIAAGGIGFLTAYLLDPDRGRSRRAQLADQTAARARRATDWVGSKMRYQRGVAKGIAHRLTSPFRRETDLPTGDLLLQKVRSEAVGHWEIDAVTPHNVEVDIREGNVMVRGSVASADDRRRLVEAILDVDGVDTLEDRLTVG